MWSEYGEAWGYNIWGRQDSWQAWTNYPVKGYHTDQTRRAMRELIAQLAKGRCCPTLTRGMHAYQGRVRPSVILWTVAHQAPLSMGFSRQEYWSRLSFPPPGDLPDLGIETAPCSLEGRFFITERSRKPKKRIKGNINQGKMSPQNDPN